MKTIAGLYNGVWSQHLVFTSEKYGPFFDLLYVADFAKADLHRHAGLYIPFQSNLDFLARHRDKVEGYIQEGGTVVLEGHGDRRLFPDTRWEHAPVDQDWWMTDKANFPCTIERPDHPVFRSLSLFDANWHHHGYYAQIPATATVLQRGRTGEIVTWSDEQRGKGRLFATTLDCIVEMGVNQITHLDPFLDALTLWITGVRPVGRYAPPPAALAGAGA